VATAAGAKPQEGTQAKTIPWARILGGVLGILVCWYVWTRPLPKDLKPGAMQALALMGLMVVWWAFRVFDEWAVALIYPTYLISAKIVPSATALSALTGSTWWTLVAAIGLGVVVIKSGLLQRISYWMLLLFPPTYRGQSAAFLATGIITTPIIPTTLGKMAIMNPIALAVAKGLGYKENSEGAAGLGMSVWVGFSIPFFLFVTGSTTPLAVYGLLPNKASVSYFDWVIAAWPLALGVIVLSYIAVLFLYKPEKSVTGTARTVVKEALAKMGQPSRNEWLALAGLLFLMIMWSTESFHKIPSGWVGLMGLMFWAFTGAMTKADYKNIDWPFLTYLAVVISLGDSFKALGIDKWLTASSMSYLQPLTKSPLLFALGLAVATYVLRLFLASWLSFVTLMMVLFAPFAAKVGFSPLALGLVLLAALNTWVPSYQSPVYLTGYYAADGKSFTHAQSARLGIAYLFIVLVALIPSVYYWQWLGLIK